jgi:hypothetical protein
MNMMFLQTELGSKAQRESAGAAACARLQGHVSLFPSTYGRRPGNDWSAPGS